MKKYLLLATALAALASCTSDDFTGDQGLREANENGAILFESSSNKITRATSNTGTVAEMLDGQFKVYGVKNVKDESDNDVYSTVFPNYVAWNNSSLTATTSNPDGNNDGNSISKGWEYVGTTSITYGVDQTALTSEQTIKYWDYSAANYHFVAGSPVANFTYNTSGNDIATADVTGFAGHITPNNTSTPITTNPVYIAEPVNVEPNDYNKPVTFRFVRQQSRVRVGIFETIPGYVIKEIKFYNQAGSVDGTYPNNVILYSGTANYFTGATEGTATITYDWTTPTYTFAYSTGLTRSQNWYGGKFVSADASDYAHYPAIPAISSNEGANLFGSDDDMGSDYYFTVLPTTSGTDADALCLKCDYVLLSEKDGSGETIKVTGATAAIPAAFCKWAPNASYTYLFKISDNSNGYTGGIDPITGDPIGPEGLYPITFDAVVIEEADGSEQGTITTVSTPSITTYQEGSVTSDGIKYTKNKPIYFTVTDNEDGTLKDLSALTYGSEEEGAVQVYVAEEGATEADMVVTRPRSAHKFATTVGNDAWTINGQTLIASKWASFTPTVARTYVIEYYTAADGSTPAYFTYKVVKVEN